MPHPTKKQKVDCHQRDDAVADNHFVASFDDLSVDVLANILAFLSIMSKRRLNKKSMEAVKKTIVPLTDFWVDDEKAYNAMEVMTRAMPNLQQIRIGFEIGQRHKYNDGEDPNEKEIAETADWTSHDIEIISNFSKLQELIIDASLNGRYPVLFNFPFLQKLSIMDCTFLKWDLGMLAGFPLLKEMYCRSNPLLTGNISSLRLLKDTLESVTVDHCWKVEGNFMDLADFPHLKELELEDTAVTGDIRDIGNNYFLSLEKLILPKGVYGGRGYELQRISDAPDVVRAVYLFIKQRPALSMLEYWHGKLSEDSPDWYESVDEDVDSPPFYVCFVQAGPRLGYRWETKYDDPCEVNWLDPEPESGSSGYEDYVADYHHIRKADSYRGYYDPPSEEKYNLLDEEILSESDEDED